MRFWVEMMVGDLVQESRGYACLMEDLRRD